MTVTAGPGWGKSGLVSAWAREHGAVPYVLGADDRDPAALADGLLALGPAAGRRLEGREPSELARQLRLAWAPHGAVALALDDAHELSDHPGLALLAALCDLAGPDLRLLVASRRDVGLVDERRRGSGDVLELDARHLALDTDDVATLLEAELDADRPLAARIVDATGGWPAAVRLLLDALHDVPAPDRSAAVVSLAAPTGPVGSYLRGAVLPAAGEATRRTLTQIALLGRAEPRQLAAVTGVTTAEAAELSAQLLGRGLVRRDPTDAAEPAVAVPPALRQVLLEEDLPERADRHGLVEEVVLGLLAEGAVGRGLDVLTVADHPEQAAELLEEHGDTLLHAGELRTVAAAAAALPAELRSADIERLHGQALAFRGEWSSALRCLSAAGAAPDGPLSTETALGLGLVHHLRGELAAAIEVYERAPQDADGPRATELRSWLATAHWLRGELDDARVLADQVMEAAERLADDRLLALAHTAQALVAASDGDRRANEAHYRQALTAAERAGDELQQARILTNRGSHHLEHGRYAEALRETERAIDLAEAQSFAPILGVARCNRAETMLRTGRLDEAIADAETARDVFARIGSRNESYPQHLLGDARREQGDLVLARIAYERAIRLAGPAGDRQGLVPAHIGLAKTLAGTDPGTAARAAERAVALDDGMARAEALLARAWVALAAEERDQARAFATEALDHATARENQPAIAEAVTCLALLSDDPLPGLRDALRLWEETGAPLSAARVGLGIARRSPDGGERSRADELARRLTDVGAAPDRGAFIQRLVAGADVLPRTTIRVLGDLVVERDGRPVPLSAWGSRKARDLLKVLVVRGGRSATREELADLLWPDEPYDAVANRLSVALSVLRGVLAPDDTGAASPIASEGATVRLASDAVDIDADRFRRLAEDGLAAARRGDVGTATALLTSAEAAYGGDLLEDDRDVLWLADRREELRSMYVSVARTLAELTLEHDPDLAMRLLLRVLDRDPYDEPAHLGVCTALARSGRHGEARRRYRLYADRMADLELPAVPFHEIWGPGAHRRAG